MRSPRLYETRDRVLGALRRLCPLLDAAIYVFGSYARGDHMLHSDVDIVVVTPALRYSRAPERVSALRPALPHTVSFDIVALTPWELSEALERSPLIRAASREWLPACATGNSTQMRVHTPP
jgi:predicted nucleotidyltransferase